MSRNRLFFLCFLCREIQTNSYPRFFLRKAKRPVYFGGVPLLSFSAMEWSVEGEWGFFPVKGWGCRGTEAPCQRVEQKKSSCGGAGGEK